MLIEQPPGYCVHLTCLIARILPKLELIIRLGIVESYCETSISNTWRFEDPQRPSVLTCQ